MVPTILVLFACVLIPGGHAGLLGAGSGAGSCAAFPYRSDDLDHVGGCPRWAECCTEFGYCHSKDSWLEGNFRDCNGESNGTPLPGSVIRLEAQQAAQGQSQITADFLGISQEIWQSQVQKATTLLSSTSTSSVSSQSQQSTFSGQSQSVGSTSLSTLSTSDLVGQIVLALQPQIAVAVKDAVQANSGVSSAFISGNAQQQQSLQAQQQFQQQQSLQAQQQFQQQQSLQAQQQFQQQQLIAGAQGTGVAQSGVISDDIIRIVVAQLTPQIANAVNSVVQRG